MANYHFYSTVAFLYFLLIPSLVLAQPNCNSNHGVVFTFPTIGDVFNYGDVVNVSWTSSFTDPLLYTFCANSTTNDIQEQLTNVASFDAFLLVQLQWPNVDNCFFDLRPNTSACYGANSPTFNVIQQTRAPTTIGLAPTTIGLAPTTIGPAPTAAPSSTTTTSALTTSTGTSTSESDATLTTSSHTTTLSLSTSTSLLLTTSTGISTTSTGPVPATVTVTTGGASSSSTGGVAVTKSSTGLSSGAKAGIGVGVALGAAAVVAGLATFFLRRRRNTAQGTYEDTGAGSQDQKNGAWYGGSNPQSPPGQYLYMQPVPDGELPGEQKSPAVVPPVSHELQAEPERMVYEMSHESSVRNPGRNRFSWQQTPR